MSTLKPFIPKYARDGREIVLGATPGCVSFECTIDEYHRDTETLSCSLMKLLLRSGAHFAAAEKRRRQQTASQRMGNAIHCAILEPHTFNDRYAVWEGDGTRATNAYKAFAAEHPGKTILTPHELEIVEGAVESARNFTAYPLAQILADGQPEKSIFFVDEDTGITVRTRPDLEHEGLTLDVKTTDDVRPEAFSLQVRKLDYDMQAYIELEGTRRFYGEIRPMAFLAIEDRAPHAIWVHNVAKEETIESGRKKYRLALERYARCRDSGTWDAYDHPVSDL